MYIVHGVPQIYLPKFKAKLVAFSDLIPSLVHQKKIGVNRRKDNYNNCVQKLLSSVITPTFINRNFLFILKSKTFSYLNDLLLALIILKLRNKIHFQYVLMETS